MPCKISLKLGEQVWIALKGDYVELKCIVTWSVGSASPFLIWFVLVVSDVEGLWGQLGQRNAAALFLLNRLGQGSESSFGSSGQSNTEASLHVIAFHSCGLIDLRMDLRKLRRNRISSYYGLFLCLSVSINHHTDTCFSEIKLFTFISIFTEFLFIDNILLLKYLDSNF